MTEKKFAGLIIEPKVSIGNVLTVIVLLVSVIGFGTSMKADITRNSDSIREGILPKADLRVTALETQVNIELRGLRNEIGDLKREIRGLRALLMPIDKRGG